MKELLHNPIPTNIMSNYGAQRHRIGRIAGEYTLVYVDTYTVDALANDLSAYGSVNYSAADFTVMPVYVVRPLEGKALSIVIQDIFQGKCTSH